MSFSVRLDEKTKQMLEKTAKVLQTKKSEVIKRSLGEYCPRILREKKKSAYELIEDLLGREGSGKGDLASNGEEILRERFRRRS